MREPHDLKLPDFLEERRKNLPMEQAFAKWQGPVSAWRQSLLTQWRSSLPSFGAKPVRLVSQPDQEGVFTLEFPSGALVRGCLKFPSGRMSPSPAALLLHDHGGIFEIGWEKLFRTPQSRDIQKAYYEGEAVAERCLEEGIAVCCLDAFGWGERDFGGYEQQQAMAANAFGLGWSLAGIVAMEDCLAAEWLASHPLIDADRIAAFGFSFGGFRAWQVAALSTHICKAASMSWMACRQDLMVAGSPLLRGQSANYMLHPSLAADADFPDLAGLALPKPLFFRSGRVDPHMPEASVKRAWSKLDAIAAACGGPAINSGFHDCGHVLPTHILEEAVNFIAADSD